MIQKNLKGLEIIEVLITSHVKVFLRNKYNNYIHTTQNAKVELLEMLSEACVEPIQTFTMKLFKENN